MAITNNAIAAAIKGWRWGGTDRATPHHKSVVAAEPHVPGPGCRRPMPKKVATTVAQIGAFDDEAFISTSVFTGIIDL